MLNCFYKEEEEEEEEEEEVLKVYLNKELYMLFVVVDVFSIFFL